MQRLMRPIGYTHLAFTYHKSNEKKDRIKMTNYLIQAFINGNLLFPYLQQTNLKDYTTKKGNEAKGRMGKASGRKETLSKESEENNTKYIIDIRMMEYSTLAGILGWTEIRLQQRIESLLSKQAEKTNGAGLEARNIAMIESARVYSQGLIIKGLARSEALDQWGNELLAVSRIKGYHAGTVMATNSALNNALLGAKQVYEMVQKMAPNKGTQHSSPTVVINNRNGTHTGDLVGNQILTTTMALSLLEAHKINALPEGPDLDLIYLKHDLSHMPEVKAIGADAQGTKKFEPREMVYDNHEERRASELDIVEGQVE